jgi:hypothetical protein
MIRFVEYAGRFQGARDRLTGLPPWARLLLFVASLPGILLIALSILAFLVSLLALLLLTVPLYRLLRLVTAAGPGREVGGERPGVTDFGSPGRKRVEATVTDAPAAGQGL